MVNGDHKLTYNWGVPPCVKNYIYIYIPDPTPVTITVKLAQVFSSSCQCQARVDNHPSLLISGTHMKCWEIRWLMGTLVQSIHLCIEINMLAGDFLASLIYLPKWTKYGQSITIHY